MSLERCIKKIYNQGQKELCHLIPKIGINEIHTAKGIDNVPISNCRISVEKLNDFEMQLLKDSINHVLLEFLYDNAVNTGKISSDINFICNKYKQLENDGNNNNFKFVISRYVYGHRNPTKKYKKDFNIEIINHYIIKYYEELLTKSYDKNHPFPEARIWLGLFKDDLSQLGAMTDKDIRRLSSTILSMKSVSVSQSTSWKRWANRNTLCGDFLKEAYFENKDKADTILFYYHMEKVCRFSLVISLDKFIKKCAVNRFSGKEYNCLNLLTYINDEEMANMLSSIINQCMEYTFSYDTIIDAKLSEIISETVNFHEGINNSNAINTKSIVDTCICIKKLLRKELDKLYSENAFCLNELRKYISDNFKYYFPFNDPQYEIAKKWLEFETSTDNTYIANITYYIHVLQRFFPFYNENEDDNNKEKNISLYWYIHDQYWKHFPYNGAYCSCIINSTYSEEDLHFIFEKELPDDINEGINFLSMLSESKLHYSRNFRK